jgi:hypothetical protein
MLLICISEKDLAFTTKGIFFEICITQRFTEMHYTTSSVAMRKSSLLSCCMNMSKTICGGQLASQFFLLHSGYTSPRAETLFPANKIMHILDLGIAIIAIIAIYVIIIRNPKAVDFLKNLVTNQIDFNLFELKQLPHESCFISISK